MKRLLFLAAGLAASALLSGCGNTMYGMGLDMERAGRKMQIQHDPGATSESPSGPDAYQQSDYSYGYGDQSAQPYNY